MIKCHVGVSNDGECLVIPIAHLRQMYEGAKEGLETEIRRADREVLELLDKGLLEEAKAARERSKEASHRKSDCQFDLHQFTFQFTGNKLSSNESIQILANGGGYLTTVQKFESRPEKKEK